MKKLAFVVALCASMLSIGIAAAQDQRPRTAVDTLLLRQFRPRSVFNLAETRVEKPRYAVIDSHSHDYASGPEDVAQWVKNMDEAGIEVAHLMSCNWIGRPYEVYIPDYQEHLDRFRFWCSFDYTDFDKPDWEERALAKLQHYYDLGFIGVGEMGDKG
ncbi:MAG: hypothetical protein LBU97_03850, partial [Alistipes sp.]|nr:hypothetical protein [Alistipes sp.]